MKVVSALQGLMGVLTDESKVNKMVDKTKFKTPSPNEIQEKNYSFGSFFVLGELRVFK